MGENTNKKSDIITKVVGALYVVIAIAAGVFLIPTGNMGYLYFLLVLIVGLILFIYILSMQHAYICKQCKHKFKISPFAYISAQQKAGTKHLKCPNCKKTTWAKIINK